MAVLLLVSAGFVVPVARVGAPRATAAIVWVYKSAECRRVLENFVAGSSAAERVSPAVIADDSLADTVLDTALFQRPPPA